MNPRAVSPVLVGRSSELDRLEAALAAAPGAILVGGEAGVGKTRLIREFMARSRDQAIRLLAGGCLELGSDGLPFAPFTAILRGLVREIGIDGVGDLLPRAATGGLARLLPEFGELPSHPAMEGDAASGEERARLFELVLTLLERLAEQGPVLVVVEDAHWADRSTRDLLAFLIRNVGTAPLLIVVTYRTDELHRTHPLRPLLAELERVDRVRRFEVTRLTRAEVAELASVILDDEPPAQLVDKAYERSEGNPLFVEALLARDGRAASGTQLSELPESLRDLLLAGVQRLPEEAQETLRVASAGGTRIEHALLSAVSNLDDSALTRVLRPAVAANVLVVDGDGYAFRHALIREAIHDDLLPGEHTRLHTRYAEALENDAALVPSGRVWVELAHHWHAAHDATWALVSAWRAADDARKAVAYAECLTMLSRVLELWEKVPDAAERIGASHPDVLEAAVTAAEQAGEFELGVKLATAALREVDVLGDDSWSACLLERRGRMSYELAMPGYIDDLRAAVKRIPAEPPTLVRARALSSLAAYARLLTSAAEAREAAEESLAIARALKDQAAEANALVTLACVEMDYDDRLEELDQVEEIARSSGNSHPLLRVALIKSHYLEGAGRHREAVEVARRGIALAVDHGLRRTQGSFITINMAEPLVSLGRWDEALAALNQAFEQDPVITIRTSLHVLTGEVLLARGELDGAEAHLGPAAEIMWHKSQDYFAMLRLEVALRLAQGRPAEALAAAENVLQYTELPDDARYAWPVLVLAAAACGEPGGRDAEMLARIEARVASLHRNGPLQEAHRLTFLANAARARGTLDLAAWEAAAAAWETLGQPYSQAQALVRVAEAASQTGDRQLATERLQRASELAEGLGALPLLARIEDLSRRARLQGAGAESTPLGLTPRELEVLRLVTAGRSNRDIATALFISAKTASVHVSNILGKLGVTGRGEAAATAHRLGLFDSSPVA